MCEMKHNSKAKKALIMVAILILVLVLLYSGLQILESTFFRQNEGTLHSGSDKTIVRDGVEYYPRQDITVMMVAGIDEDGPVTDSDSYNNSGEADMVSLLVFSEDKETVDILCLNRDTMMDIPVLGLNGKPAGTIYGQLALAHTYGSGLTDSSENLCNAVSKFLYNTYIDYYVTMNMDAIGILNDAVGGVTVNVTEDFSAVDPSITMGEVKLSGKQAITYVRTRAGVGNQMNLTRMERHKTYMKSFMDVLVTKLDSDRRFVTNTYVDVTDYIVTDCSANSLAVILDRFSDYGLGDIVSIEGENRKGDEFMEYYVDEDALDEIILKYLYAPKK